MVSLPVLRQDIAAAVNGITTTTGTLTAYAQFPPSYSFPCLVVGPYSKGHIETFEGARRWTFDLHIYVRATDLSYGQNELDPLLSDHLANSIEDAIEASPALVGLVNVFGFDKPGGLTVIKTNTGDISVLGWVIRLEYLA